MQIVIDKEFQSLIPPLTDEEYEGLEKSILADGCRDALVLWGDILVDGHNRYEICTAHGVPFRTVQMEFADRNDAMAWIIKNQFGRRNLPAYERARLALRLKPVIAERAKEKQGERVDIPKKSWECIERDEIQKIREMHLGYDAERNAIANARQEIGKQRRRERMASETHIYFMRIGDEMKVGSSTDVESRLQQLRVAAPGITLVGDIHFGEGARKHENNIRKKFAEYHISGEVYHYSDLILQEMMDYTRREANRNKETDTILARAAGVSHDTIAKVAKIEAAATDEVKQQLRSGNISINEAYKTIKREELREKRDSAIQDQLERPKTTNHVDIFSTEKKYRVIYADPPWSYSDKQNIETLGGAVKHYLTMPLQDICALPVPAADNAVLFMWVTSPMLEDGFRVINAWGFRYKSSFVWDKVAHNMGHYNSVRHELLLIATRGSCLPDVPKLFDSVVSIERTEHSSKPAEFRDMIDTLYPVGERLELFAREAPEGWDVWGNMA